jgi:hypothetical protein
LRKSRRAATLFAFSVIVRVLSMMFDVYFGFLSAERRGGNCAFIQQ